MSVRRIGGAFIVLAAACLPIARGVAQSAAPGPAPAAAPGRAHEQAEKRVATLRSQLKITPAQTKAFDDFAQVMRDNADKMDALDKEQSPKLRTMSAVDQMKAYEAMTQEQADGMQRMVPAYSRLYDAFSPEQKRIADDSSRQAVSGR